MQGLEPYSSHAFHPETPFIVRPLPLSRYFFDKTGGFWVLEGGNNGLLFNVRDESTDSSILERRNEECKTRMRLILSNIFLQFQSSSMRT